jgi:hypothetical protein
VSATTQAESGRRRTAILVTEVFSPMHLVPGLLLLVAWRSAPSHGEAVATGLVSALFASLLPFALLSYWVRRGRLADRRLRHRHQRPFMMIVALASIVFGLVLLLALGASRELLALVAAMITGLATTLLVTLKWKISIHAAVAAGTTVILALVFGPQLLLVVAPVVALVAWSRVELGEHTGAQAAAGVGVGALGAASVYSLLR